MGGVRSAGWSFTPTSRPGATHAECQITVSHRYSNFFWWWAYGCPKHVEKRNKYTKQNCAPSWIYLQQWTETIYSVMTSVLFCKYTLLTNLKRAIRLKCKSLGYTHCHQNDISESELLLTFSLGWWFFGHCEGQKAPQLINILLFF